MWKSILIFFLLFSITGSAFSGGSGTADDPWQVADIYDLQEIGSNDTTLSGYYLQINDIDASVTRVWNNEEGFLPIAYDKPHAFNGYYDGGNYSIYGLYINRPSMQRASVFYACSVYEGLFGSGSYIKNINLINISIVGNRDAAGIAGYITSGFTITNCGVNGDITSTANFTGGLVGESSSSYISKCKVSGNITGVGFAGGLVGASNGDEIENCYSIARINCSNYAGGLIGNFPFGSIMNSYAAGQMNTTGSNLGGAIGRNVDGTINGVYYDSEVSGLSDSGKGESKTTLEMQNISTFIGWDFENVWVMNGYPTFIVLEIINEETSSNTSGGGSKKLVSVEEDDVVENVRSVSNNIYIYAGIVIFIIIILKGFTGKKSVKNNRRMKK